MASINEVWTLLHESEEQDRFWRALESRPPDLEQRHAAERLRQALADEERRKAELLADALARRLRPVEPEPSPVEPEPSPVEPEPSPPQRPAPAVSDKAILARLEAGESIKRIHQKTGASMPRIRRVKEVHKIPNATPGPKPKAG